MKTPVELIDDMYLLLNVASVQTVIASGDIFSTVRPDDHRKEALVINCLPISGDQLQKSVVNVNIHVPNLAITINGQPDNSQPDRKRIKEISDVVVPIVKDALINNTITEIQSINLFADDVLKEHFLNIRVATNSINI